MTSCPTCHKEYAKDLELQVVYCPECGDVVGNIEQDTLSKRVDELESKLVWLEAKVLSLMCRS